jgi:hypothetical protein
MKANNVDVFVLVKGATDKTGMTPILERIRKTTGVNQVRVNEHVQSLLLVEYDPAETCSQNIMASIQQQGYRAAFVGM